MAESGDERDRNESTEHIELRLDLAEAKATGNAALCVLTALIASLTVKNILSPSDVVALTADAKLNLDEMTHLSDVERRIANAVIQGYANSWAKLDAKT